MIRRIEKFLYRKGFKLEAVRQLIAWQLILAVCSSVVVAGVELALGSDGRWSVGFVVTTVLVTINFVFLARFAQEIVHMQKGAVGALQMQFFGRLIVTGLVLYGLIVWVKTPIVSLLLGVSTVVATLVAWGLNRVLGQNAKEA